MPQMALEKFFQIFRGLALHTDARCATLEIVVTVQRLVSSFLPKGPDQKSPSLNVLTSPEASASTLFDFLPYALC